MNIHSIRVKSSLPSLLLGLTIILMFITFSWMLTIQEEGIKAQADNFLHATSLILNADRDIYQAKVAQDGLLNGNGDAQSQEKDRLENAQQVIDRYHKYISYMKDYPDVVEKSAGFEQAYTLWKQASDRLVKAKLDNLGDLANLEADTTQKFQQLRGLLNAAGEAALAKSESSHQALLEQTSRSSHITMLVVGIVLLIAAWFSYRIPKVLTEDITSLVQRIRDIASGDGDLTAQLEVKSKNEFAELATAFNDFAGNLRKLVSEVMTQAAGLDQLTHTLAGSSEQSRNINQALNAAADSIVSAVHEMTLANKEMAQVATGTARESDRSAELAHQGIDVVNNSNQRIQDLVADINNVMTSSEQLQENSENIVAVLDVIRGVAEQTNLLALNAAIEAARAGEQGRGFAVVADEVRTLATRTQESTNDIQEIIEQLRNSVSVSSAAIMSGKKNADLTEESFQQAIQVFESIQDSSVKVNDLASQTAQATEEQTNVAEEVNQNLHQLNEQTVSAKEVAEMGEQISEQVRAFSRNLNQLVSHFKV